jgi:5-oxoprolinase (ATP-hydrolysing)
MRFQGSDTPLMIQESRDILSTFKSAHQKQFGFLPVGRDVIIDDFRVRSIGRSESEAGIPWPEQLASLKAPITANASETKNIYFRTQGWTSTPTYSLTTLLPGTIITGPALIMDDKQTILLIPSSTATILTDMVIIDLHNTDKAKVSAEVVDPIQLSIFGHRFMGVAEQMGRALQKTSVSTNIKERLDFSCTVFSPEGGLVANAPHVPAMVSQPGGKRKGENG